MPDFNRYLMGLASICDNECSVHFQKCKVTIYDPQLLPLLQGWRDNKGAKLWLFSLRPQSSTPSSTEEDGEEFTIVPKSGFKFSNLQALVGWLRVNVTKNGGGLFEHR